MSYTRYSAAPRARGRARGSRAARPSPGRSLVRMVVGLALTVALIAVVASRLQHVAGNSGLPLSDASVIREQAADKHLDPALIAGVIYAETKFDPRTSSAGALGLMQILPQTAEYLAHRSGATTFTVADLSHP